MDDLVKDIIPLLQYLIPGFLSTWIFYSLTAFKRPDTFGQIVQALIFTFVIQGAVLAVGNLCLWVGSKGFSLGSWDDRAQTLWAFVFSLMLVSLPVTWLRVTNCTAGYVSETSRNNLLSPVNGSALSPSSTGS